MPPSAAIAQPMFTVNRNGRPETAGSLSRRSVNLWTSTSALSSLQETVIRNAFPPHPDRKRARDESDSFRSAAAVRSSASACPMQALIAV